MLLRSFALSLLCLGASVPLTGDPTLSEERKALATDELPDWLAPLLQTEGLHVVDGGEPMVTFWLRRELPTQEPSSEFGVDFQKFPPGAVIGLVSFERDWSDYRKRVVAKGLYTMRYGVQPADGDHTGQTYFRDFLMLLPLASDEFPPEGQDDPEPLVEVSKLATGTEHPGVIALYQIYDPVESAGIVRNDFDEPCLALPLPELVMGMVLFGHGQELPV